MNRREFCKSAGLIVGGGSTALAPTGSDGDHPGSIPVVMTRGHFEVEFTLDFWNDDGLYRDRLVDGHSKYDYDTAGSIPWDADELVVILHGWTQESDEAAEIFESAASELRSTGYEGGIVGYSYDLSLDIYRVWEVGRWWAHRDVARRNGHKLANFLDDLKGRNPDVTVRLVGLSMGGQTILKALQALDRMSYDVSTVSLMGGAVKDHLVARDSEFGPAIAANCDEFHNYYRTDDVMLQAFQAGTGDVAVGEEGCDGKPPANYRDHDVTDAVSFHSFYPTSDGCIPQVVDDWDTVRDDEA